MVHLPRVALLSGTVVGYTTWLAFFRFGYFEFAPWPWLKYGMSEKAYAGRAVLKGISFDLQKGERIGLIGANGSGKTTLLKLLAGMEQPDQGRVTVARACKLAYVAQIPTLDPEQTLHHQVSQVFEEVHEIERQMHAAGEDLADTPKDQSTMRPWSGTAGARRNFSTCKGMTSPGGSRRAGSTGFGQRGFGHAHQAAVGWQKSRAQLGAAAARGAGFDAAG